MPRRLLSAAAACTFILGLAACGEDSDGPVSTPPPSIDAGGPSDGVGDGDASDGGGDDQRVSAAPDAPAPDPADYSGMDENTPEGAEQAFRYYIAVSMWAHQSGDDSPLPDLEENPCERCTDFNQEIPELKRLGEYWSPFEVKDVSVTSHKSPTFGFEVGYLFTLPTHQRPNLDNGSMVEYKEVEYALIGGMNWTAGGWRVADITGEWGPDAHR